MKRLDKFVEVLFLRKADKLVLTSGSAAYVVGPGSARQPVTQRALSTAQIISNVEAGLSAASANGISQPVVAMHVITAGSGDSGSCA